MPEDEKERLLQSVKRDIGDTGNSTSDSFSYFIIGLFCAVMILVIIVFALERSKENKLASLKETYEVDVTQPLKTLEKEQKESDNAVKQLEILTTALSKRIKYSQLMADIASHQFKKSFWQSFTLRKEKIAILGSADSYDDVAKSIAAFRSLKAVKDVSLKAANKDEDTGKFNFSAEISVDLDMYQYANTTDATKASTVLAPTATPGVKQ